VRKRLRLITVSCALCPPLPACSRTLHPFHWPKACTIYLVLLSQAVNTSTYFNNRSLGYFCVPICCELTQITNNFTVHYFFVTVSCRSRRTIVFLITEFPRQLNSLVNWCTCTEESTSSLTIFNVGMSVQSSGCRRSDKVGRWTRTEGIGLRRNLPPPPSHGGPYSVGVIPDFFFENTGANLFNLVHILLFYVKMGTCQC